MPKTNIHKVGNIAFDEGLQKNSSHKIILSEVLADLVLAEDGEDQVKG